MDTSPLIKEIKEEFPSFSIVYKTDSKMMKTIDTLFKTFTFGKNSSFMKEYVTTINNTVYVNTDWDKYTENMKYVILSHERIHMRQARKYGFLLYAFLYLFVFFPIGLAYFRAKFEKEAYTESMKCTYNIYGQLPLLSKKYKEYIMSQFTGPAYLWMFPFKNNIESWYDNTVKEILSVPRTK